MPRKRPPAPPCKLRQSDTEVTQTRGGFHHEPTTDCVFSGQCPARDACVHFHETFGALSVRMRRPGKITNQRVVIKEFVEEINRVCAKEQEG